MAYVPQPFPKMLYLDGQSCVVPDAGAEMAAKRSGWGEVPSWTTEMAVAALEPAPTFIAAPAPDPGPVFVTLDLSPAAETTVEPPPELVTSSAVAVDQIPEIEPLITPAPVAPRHYGKGRRR